MKGCAALAPKRVIYPGVRTADYSTEGNGGSMLAQAAQLILKRGLRNLRDRARQ